MTVIKADSWQNTSGVPFNRCLQVVTALQPSSWNLSSSAATQTYYNTNLAGSITLKKSNSRVLLIADITGYQGSSSYSAGFNIGIRRTIAGSSSLIMGVESGGPNGGDTWTGFGYLNGQYSYNIQRQMVDTPAQTRGTAITYTVCIGRWQANDNNIGVSWDAYNAYNKIIMMEIEA